MIRVLVVFLSVLWAGAAIIAAAVKIDPGAARMFAGLGLRP